MASNIVGQTALLIGATGATGRHLLRELLDSQQYTRVLEAGRRVTPQDQLPENAKGKLEQRVIDFEKLDEARLGEGYDVVYITLGTTRKAAGTAEDFEKIDRHYVVNAAKAAKSSAMDRAQRLVYLSSGGSNPNSNFLYMRSKGLTEKALSELGYHDVIIFRPGLLEGRAEPRLPERIISPVFRVLSLFSASLAIQTSQLGKAIRVAGTLGSDNLPPSANASKDNLGGKDFTVIGNGGSIALAHEDV